MCVVIAVLTFGAISISNGKDVFVKELEHKLFYYAEDYAYQFSREFENQESSVKSVSAIAQEIFLTSDYENNREVFERRKDVLGNIMRAMIIGDEKIVSLYFTFNPNTSHGKDEIWYIRKTRKVELVDSVAISNTWLIDSEATAYYYDAVKEGALWSDAGYDPGLDAEVVTYSRAVYDEEGSLIGVAGADIFIDEILNTVSNINIYKSGAALLANADADYITGSWEESDYNKIRKKIDSVSGYTREKKTGLIHYTYDDIDYIMAYAPIYNGWYLLVNQVSSETLTPLNNSQMTLIIAAIIIMAISLIYALYFSRKQVKPIIKESERKDIYIINQERRAKLGEMVGNIAHQWKQPLNSMGINLTNMADEFHEGELDSEAFDDYVKRLRQHMRNMSDTVDDFADFLKPDKKKERFSVMGEIKKVINLMIEETRTNNIIITIEGTDLTVYGFRNEFAQSIFNIINNARDAILLSKPDDREILIWISEGADTLKRDTKTVNIRIYNKGNPIPDSVAKKLFEPYFTTREDSKGTGLGLYMSRTIIEDHMGGSLRFENIDGGVCWAVSVPRGVEDGIS